MSSDDLTNDCGEEKTTQPTITAVFRLLQKVSEEQSSLQSRLELFEQSVNLRFESLEKRFESHEKSVDSRFNAIDERLAMEFARIDARFVEMSDEFAKALLQLSDKLCDRIDLIRLQADAGYEDLLRRLRRLESKAS